MSLTGEQRELLYDSLLASFRRGSLKRLLSFKLNKKIYVISSNRSNLADLVLDVIHCSEQEGWTEELIQVACQKRPNCVKLQYLADELNITVGDYPVETRRYTIYRVPTPHYVRLGDNRLTVSRDQQNRTRFDVEDRLTSLADTSGFGYSDSKKSVLIRAMIIMALTIFLMFWVVVQTVTPTPTPNNLAPIPTAETVQSTDNLVAELMTQLAPTPTAETVQSTDNLVAELMTRLAPTPTAVETVQSTDNLVAELMTRLAPTPTAVETIQLTNTPTIWQLTQVAPALIP